MRNPSHTPTPTHGSSHTLPHIHQARRAPARDGRLRADIDDGLARRVAEAHVFLVVVVELKEAQQRYLKDMKSGRDALLTDVFAERRDRNKAISELDEKIELLAKMILKEVVKNVVPENSVQS